LEMYCDANKWTFLIVLHLYKGSMCELLTENELNAILKNGILQTLDTMHSNGYIHGDIKPENLVYEKEKTAIIDYDLCTEIKQGHTTRSEWRGTLGYSAPEWSPYHSIKSMITTKVDIYSLGLTMLILLCGEQPFLCPTAVKQRLEKEDPPP